MSTDHQTLSTRHLLGCKNLSKKDIEAILKKATEFATAAHKPKIDESFKRLVCANLFFEPSTRTKLSFEVACNRLGVKPVNFDPGSSSLKKDETLLDTFLNVAAMKPDVMVIRQGEDGFLEKLAGLTEIPLVNAGDGTGEHPTQALLDALTISQAKGNLTGLKVAICGDLVFSRVAKSNFYLLPKLGTKIVAFDPFRKILIKTREGLQKVDFFDGVEEAKTFEDAIRDADIIMMLRVQRERWEEPVPLRRYSGKYGLTKEKLKNVKKDALVMHPGPLNRGVEIASEVADDPKRSLILKQVTNGVAVRMAILDLLTRPVRKK